MEVKSESHKKVKICSFHPIGMKFGEDNFFVIGYHLDGF